LWFFNAAVPRKFGITKITGEVTPPKSNKNKRLSDTDSFSLKRGEDF